MHRRRNWILLAIVCGTVTAYCWRGQYVSKAHSALFIPTKSLDLGELWAQRGAGKLVTCRLPIYNTSNNDIDLDRITGSCKCTTVQPGALRVPGHGCSEISIKVEVLPGSLADPLVTRRHVDVDIGAHSPQFNDIWRWRIQYTVKPWLKLSTPEVVFVPDDNELEPSHKFRRRIISYETAVPVTTLDATSDSSDVDVFIIKETDTAGRIAVAPNSRIPAGRFGCTVSVSATSPQCALPSVLLQVSGVSVHDVYALPSNVTFGPMTLGESGTARVTFASRGHHAFTVAEIGSHSSAVSFRLLDGDGSDAHVYEVSQTAVERGRQHGVLTCRATSDDGTVTEVPIDITYIGIPYEVPSK
jgi:hypothetical protein